MTTALTLRTKLPAATEPAEVRGAGRDDVRLLTAGADGLTDGRFGDLPRSLRPGDLLVVNTSATMPASLRADGGLRVNVSTELPGGYHTVEVRLAEGPVSRPLQTEPPRTLNVAGGGRVTLLDRYPAGSMSRLWLARLELDLPTIDYLGAHGEPIRYPYITKPWPIQTYQTVFGSNPGSAEMPSSARPFTHEMVTRLTTSGVTITPLILHTGVSSLESGEQPYPEWYSVPDTTTHLVNTARQHGGRVIAVGTTVVRALETVTAADGTAHPATGWTDVVVTPDRGAPGIDGLITGWHAPESSHLDMLEAIGGAALIAASYDAAFAGGYLWHEFGDLHLMFRPERDVLSGLRAA
jgi:S-adenosylmethionine:tRNA ribosyltransferase-isomerase